MKVNKGVIHLATKELLLPMLLELLVEVQAAELPKIILPSRVKSNGFPILTIDVNNNVVVAAMTGRMDKISAFEDYVEVDVPKEWTRDAWQSFLKFCDTI